MDPLPSVEPQPQKGKRELKEEIKAAASPPSAWVEGLGRALRKRPPCLRQ